ncbi:restriction endonuclease subunit S [Flavobacterium sp.]|uniref:restriction endonuclease subunit S n=1 Tax=Flavobacterium sp. TaxID=239 RepID=UPI00286E9AFA|nr:restriction endonuclease subunit S [Flavobacterium sp.]
MLKKHFSELFDFQKKSKIKAGDGLKLEVGKYPFYTSSNVLTKSIDKYLFDKPSLIFGTGGLASVHFSSNKFAVSTDCLVAQPKDDKIIFSKYVYHYLSGNIHILEEGFKGAGLKHISKGYISNISIPLPSLETQKKIVQILDDAAALRNKTEQLIKEYDALGQSIFFDMFGDPVKNSKGWKSKKLGDICDIGSSRRVFVDELVEEGIPFYRGKEIGELSTNKSIKSELFILKEHYENLKKETGVPKIGDLLMPSICPDGRILRVNNNDPFYFKDGRVLWIKIDHLKINSFYLKTFLKELFYKNYSKIASGTTFAELKIVALKKIKFLEPPLSLQNEYAEKITLIEKQKELAKQELKESEDLFNCLLQKAFKGELV